MSSALKISRGMQGMSGYPVCLYKNNNTGRPRRTYLSILVIGSLNQTVLFYVTVAHERHIKITPHSNQI